MSSRTQHTTALDQLLEVTVLLNDDMTRSLAQDGLTVARAHLLWELHRRGPTTQQALADALAVTPRNITGLVDGLVATGFVTREPHPTDRRATLVSFTDHGARTTKAMDEAHHELAEQLFAKMSDRQFAGLVKGLDAVLVRLRELVAAAKAAQP